MKPEPENHDKDCQRALTKGCDCRCRGMLHQRNILIAAIESRGSVSMFDDEVTNLYGSAFTLLSSDPVLASTSAPSSTTSTSSICRRGTGRCGAVPATSPS